MNDISTFLNAVVGDVEGTTQRPRKKRVTWTLELVKVEFAKAGYTLLETEYVGVHKSMQCWCEKGHHDHRLSLGSVVKAKNCTVCANPWNLDTVRDVFATRGFTLLATEYKNNSTKLKFWCAKGQHEHAIKLVDFLAGNGCGGCYKRHTIEDIRHLFADCGWDLISTEYVDSKLPIRYWCRKGQHEHSIKFSSFLSGIGCGKCHYWTLEKAAALFKEKGYTLLETEYKRNNTRMRCWCEKGNHMHVMTVERAITNSICSICRAWTIDRVAAAFAARGFTLLETQYINVDTKMRFHCLQGDHEYAITMDDFIQGNGCGACKFKHTLESVTQMFADCGFTLLETSYTNTYSLLRFWCFDGEHEHQMTLNDLQSGIRCGACRQGGFRKEKSGILYYVEFDLGARKVYKIGITGCPGKDDALKAVRRRYYGTKTPYKVLWTKFFADGAACAKAERTLIHSKRHMRCVDSPVDGISNRELFDYNIFCDPSTQDLIARATAAAA